MSATLCINVDRIAATIAHFDVIKVYRSATADGTFLEATAPDTRPVLKPDVAQYTFGDASADASTFFTSSFYNTKTRQESSQSPPVQGASGGEEPLITVERLKSDYLFGLKLTDRQNAPLPDGVFETGIRAGAAWVGRRIGLQILPVDVTGERHDVRLTTSGVLPLCTLDVLPIRVIRQVSLRYPGMQSDTRSISPEDLNFNAFSGRVETTMALGGQAWSSTGYNRNANAWVQASVALYGTRRAPGALRVNYAAGFTKDTLPADILDLVAKAACLQPLAIAGDMVNEFGLSSTSIGFDGLSQSVGRSPGNAYAARILAYTTQLEAETARIRSYYRSLQLRAI